MIIVLATYTASDIIVFIDAESWFILHVWYKFPFDFYK